MSRRLNGAHQLAILANLAAVLMLSCGGARRATTPIDHRPTAPAACTPQSGPVSCTQSSADACHVPADCTAGLDGFCRYGASGCACAYDDCLTDADCAAGTACSCDANRGGAGASGNPTKCVPANCRVDADCGAGGFCSQSGSTGGPGGCGAFVTGFFCHTPDDECGNASDCGSLGMACVYSREVGHWVCEAVTICAG